MPQEAAAGCVGAGAGSEFDYAITNDTSQVVLDVDCPGPHPFEADAAVPDGTEVNAPGTDDFGVGTQYNSDYAGGAWMLTNEGVVRGSTGVYLRTSTAASEVVNEGLIEGTDLDGVYIHYGGAVTNRTGGRIVADRYAVSIQHGAGTVTNEIGAEIRGQAGVWILSDYGTVHNAGLISGLPGGVVSLGVVLEAGGEVTNEASGQIEGRDGVFITNGGGTVHNAGQIIGTVDRGVAIMGGSGTVVNTGTIIGAGTQAVAIFGGAGTVVNAGTIDRAGGNAIRFNSTIGYDDTLELQPGSEIRGQVRAYGGTDRLILGGGDGSDSFDVAQITSQYRGFDVFSKTGGSTWELTGTRDNLATEFAVEDGTLIVNAQMGQTGFRVNGGVLGGTGKIADVTIGDGGTLAPGNSIGTVTVNGSLTFGAGSVYEVEVSPSAADRTDVVAVGGPGTADLSGATVLAIYEPGSYVAKQYVIVNAAGGFGGTTFAELTGTAPSGFTQLLAYDANNAYLVLSPLQIAGLNGNQQAVSDALADYFNETGGLPSTFTGLSAGELTLISAENGTGAHTAGLGSGSEFIGLLGATPGAPEGGNAPENDLGPLAYGPDEPDRVEERFEAGFPAAGADAAAAARRYNMWGSVMGGANWLTGSAAAGSQDVAANGYGIASGIDYAAEGRFIGGALGGSWTSAVIGNGLGSARAGSFHAGIRAGGEFGRSYIAGAAAYGFHDLSTSRAVGAESYTANFIGHSLAARAEAGHRWQASFAKVTPYAAFQSVNLFTPAYAETASGAGTFALAYQAATSRKNRIEVGARLSRRLSFDNGSLTLTGSLAWARYLNRGRAVSAGFTALPGTGFVTQGATKAQNTALVSAGADFAWRSGVAASLSLDGEFGQGTASVAGRARLRLKW